MSATSVEAVVPTSAAAPGLTVVKTADTAAGTRAGDVVSYTIRATNSGNQTLTGVTVTDPLAGLSALAITWPATTGVLAPGQTAIARGTYVITQADVNTGSIRNTASAGATAPGGVPVTASSAELVTPTVTAAPRVTLDKTASLAPGATGRAGDLVTYSFTVRNAGNVTLTGVGITDALPGLSAITYAGWPGATGTLQPGQSVTASATRALTQSDVDAGSVANTARATATPPTGDAVIADAPATLPLAAGPLLTLGKSAAYTSGTGAVGSVITYTFTARNTGNVTLTGVTVTDPHAGLSPISLAWPGTAGTLAPGAQVVGTATYTVTQADVDAGIVRNSARVSGTPPSGPAIGADSPTVTLATVAAGPALTTAKSATVGGTGAVGDVVDYTVRVTNTGNVTLRDVTVIDPLPGLSAFAYTWPGDSGVLAPGAQVVARASRTITQADVDAGSLVNVATGRGVAPNGTPVTAASGTVTTPTAVGDPRLQVTKAGALPAGATGVAGETITWTVTIRNTGNVTLSGVSATDSLPGISDLAYGAWPSGTAGRLAPGDAVTATATSTVRQSDVDAGAISNAATATGTPARGQSTSAIGAGTVPLTSAPALALQKSGAYTTGSGAVGDTITYTYTLRNAGNVTLSGVAVTDPHSGLSAINYGTWPSGTAGTLGPNQTVVATATYQVRQNDVNSGSITDVATASGRPPTGAAVSATSQTVVLGTAAAAPGILTTKSASVGGAGQLGDLITYTFRATNTGNVTLTGVALSDPAPGLSPLAYGPWPGASGTLQPGESVTATATHRITQADLDTGSVTNIATSTGTPPTGPAVSDPSDTVVTPTATRAPDLEVTKSGTLRGGATSRAGDTVAYSFTLRNTGNVTLTGVALTDLEPAVSPLAYSWPGSAGTLAPNQVVTATATYILTQADIDAGGVDNTVNGSATAPGGTTISEAAAVSVPIDPAASVTVSKTGTVVGDGVDDGEVGDDIRFEFVIANTGNVTLTDVELADSIPGLVPTVTWPDPAAPGVLAPGATATAVALYDITQADVNAGSVTNAVTVTGTPPSGADVQASDDVEVATGAQRSELRLAKSGTTVAGEAGVGDVITYSFVLSNTGNVTVDDIVITDPLAGLSAIVADWPGATGVLDPGERVTATATLQITQAHVDAGRVLNTATASGSAPDGDVTASSPESTVRVEAAAPSIAVTNQGTLPPGSVAGSTVTWTYSLQNTGNVTLTGAALSDALPGTTAPVYQWNGTAGVLAPGATVTATATTVLTQADVDAGSIVSVVTGRGTAPSGAVVSAAAPATVPIDSTAGLTLVKTASREDDLAVGDVVTFTFAVTNSGTATIDAIALSDPLPGLSAISFGAWPGSPGVLAPGGTVTATASYTITQADVDRGGVSNTATATGLTPADAAVSDSDAVELTTQTRAPALELVKDDALTGDGTLGDSIEYTFTVRNAGNTTITDVAVDDELEGISGLAFGAWPRGQTGVLAPGDVATATARYTVVQRDVDAGEVVNTAVATGTAPADVDVASSDAEVTTELAPATPDLTATKRGALAAGATGRAGDIAEFRFSVVNTGDVTISEVTFDDALAGLSPLAITWPDAAAPGILAPGAEATATASYTLTQADVDAGSVANAVTVTGTPVRGALDPATAVATIGITPGAALSAVKSGVLAAGGVGVVGDTVEYVVVVTNTGNVTVTGGVLVDPMVGLYDVSIVWPDAGVPGRVGVGEQAVGRGKYDLTQADVDRGFVENTASVAASAPGGVRVSADTNTVRVNTVLPAAGLAVSKSGVLVGGGGVGDVVSYEFGVTNTGNVTVGDVVLSDALPGVVLSGVVWPDAGAPGVIAPGETATASGEYVLSQADVDAGRVVNSASASGVAVRGGPVSAVSAESVVVTDAAAPVVSVVNSGVLAPGAAGRAGDVVTFTYVLTNEGNVSLSGVVLADALGGVSAPSYVWEGAAGVLVPGQSVTATASYVLTQADVDAGGVTSVVTGTGTPPTGAPVSAAAPATVAITAAPELIVTKDDAATGGAVGDSVEYSFTIENRGNVSLSGVVLSDTLAGLSTPSVSWPGTTGVLTPGQIATATATYTITQADVDEGRIENTATARATIPGGTGIQASSDTVVTELDEAAPAVVTTKSARLADGASGAVGDAIEYTVTVRNSGNVTLSDVGIVDDLENLSDIAVVWPGAAGVLAPTQTLVGTARYVITQEDVDRGAVSNVAVGSGTDPSGTDVDDPSAQVVVDTAGAAPAATVSKAGALEPGATGRAGDLVRFTFRVVNTGNVTLSNVTLVDPLEGLSEIEVAWPAADGVLAPGAAAEATAEYALTQADVDRGQLDNTVTLSATAPDGAVIERTADAVVPITEAAELTTVKSGELLEPGIGAVGDVIEYRLVVTNTGNVTVQEGRLIDRLAGLSLPEIAWPGPEGELLVGDTVVGVARYTLTQADIDRGFVRNIAGVEAVTEQGTDVVADSNPVVINTVQPAAALTVVKDGVIDGDGGAGSAVDYTFRITNTGNVTVSAITLADPMPGLSVPQITWPGIAGVLAPGQSATATAGYVITQDDVDAGSIANAATASGSSRGGPVTSPAGIETVETQGIQASIDVRKTAEFEPGATGVAGDVVNWAYSLQNTSNVTLTGVSLADRLTDSSAPTYVWPDPARPGVLLPGQTVTAVSAYVLTQADVDRGTISSAVDGVGMPPRGADVTGSATASVEIAARPGISASKSGVVDGAGDVGDRIDYTFGITNTGNVTLTLVDLIDALVGVSAPTFDWPGEPGILLPGETVEAAAEYTITQADVDRGTVTNIATASGKPPVGDTITASTPPTNTTVAAAAPELRTEKTGVARGDGAVGDIIDYAFTIENTGNVTVTAIGLADPLPGLSVPDVRWPGEPGILAPGQIATATASYAIVQADVDAGEVVNVATAAGTTPAGTAVEDASDPARTPTIAAAAAVAIDKTGALAPGSTGQVGDLVRFAFTISNTGNQTLTDVTLTDRLVGLSDIDVVWPSDDPASVGVLPVGSQARGTATYTLTQADIDAGAVANAVEVDAATPSGAPVDASDASTVEIPRTPALSAVKSGVLAAGGVGVVGDTVEYVVVVTNTGNVTVTGGVLVDPMVGLYDVSIVWPDAGVPGRVGVGEQAVGRGKYDLTQADVDRGFVENTASVAASAPGGVRVSADTNTVRVNTVLPAAGLAVSKSGVLVGGGGVGDVVSYEFGVTNTGNVTVGDVVLSDALPGVVLSGVVWPDAGAPGVIAPGETATASGEYVLSQADVDAGRVVNTASASGVAVRGGPVSAVSAESVVVTDAAAPVVSVVNSGVLAPGAAGRAGDVVTFTYVLTNEGNVSLSGVVLADALGGVSAPSYVWEGAAGVLVPGQSVTATASYVLTQADVDAGGVTSVVTGTGTPPTGAPATAVAPATVSLAPAPGLVFTKTAALDTPGANAAGDGVTFGFRIENTGTVTLSGVAVTDDLAGIGPLTIDWPGAVGTLAPGQIARGTAAYDISQEDVDRGSVQNTASVRAMTPAGSLLTSRSTIEPLSTADHAPSIQTVKGGSYVSGTGGVGSIIEYTFDITNTGNVTLRLIRLQDDLEGLGIPQLDFPSVTGILPPGGTATGVARYTVTQADVDAGSITNVATSFGTSPRGVVVSDSSAPFTIATDSPTNPEQAIRTTQTAELAPGDIGVLGDAIDYTFTIENTGNRTLTGVTLSNTLTGLGGFVYTWPDAANPGRLLPGQTVTITASHPVTQAEVDAGTVRNVATGSGTPPTGAAVTHSTPMTIVPLAGGTGSLEVSKSGTRLGDGSVGTEIRYDFVVRNTGTLTLSSVALTDALEGLSEISYGDWPTAEGTLAPGQSVTASATYTLQQSDIDEGAVRNIAAASARTPGGDGIAVESPESVVTTIGAAPAIDVEKQQVLADGATGRPGDEVEYAFTVTNSGNVTLRGVSLADAQTGLTGLEITWPGEVGVLAPGQTASAIARYTLTRADVDAGRLQSLATTTGIADGTVVRDEDAAETLIAAAPALTLEKTAELTGAAQQGGGIRYLVTATNTGNVTLTDVAVTDELAGLGSPSTAWPGTPGVLAAGESVTVRADYVITSADVVRERVDNTASVTGTAPGGATVEASDSVRVDVPNEPSIHLSMNITVKDGQQGYAGDTLIFRYTATNTGTSSLTGVRIVDPYPGLSALTYTWPGEPGVLLPGQSVTAVASVVITAAMEGTVITSRAVVTSVEAESGVQVLDVASDAVDLPAPEPTGILPFTGGGDPLPLVAGSAALLLAGLVLMLLARRRRAERTSNLFS
ncbi:DUF7507 domain-containing protein [Microbacterium hydrocarbonoxydans]|uniref:DUF7507 domain-containing protein n=2 Tax=Microbacterium hydrocarbonoxydans TaxID=273678 RepID=UPI003B832B58